MEIKVAIQQNNFLANRYQSKIVSKKIIIYLLVAFINSTNPGYAQIEEQLITDNTQANSELILSSDPEVQSSSENATNNDVQGEPQLPTTDPVNPEVPLSSDNGTDTNNNAQDEPQPLAANHAERVPDPVNPEVPLSPGSMTNTAPPSTNKYPSVAISNQSIANQVNDPYESIIDKEFHDKIQHAVYREEDLSELLSSDQGLLWLKSDKGRTWLTSNEGKNWLQSGSPSVHRWLNTRSAQAWVLSLQGEQAMFQIINALSDKKALALTNNFEFPSLSSVFVYTTLTTIAVALIKYRNLAPSINHFVFGHECSKCDSSQHLNINQSRLSSPKSITKSVMLESNQEEVENKSGLRLNENTDNTRRVRYVITAVAVLTLSALAMNTVQSGVYAFTSFQSALDKILSTRAGSTWLYTESGIKWLLTPSGLKWLELSEGQDYLHVFQGNKNAHTVAKQLIHPEQENLNQAYAIANKLEKVFLKKVEDAEHTPGWWYDSDLDQFLSSYVGGVWLATETGIDWLQTPKGKLWQSDNNGKMRSIFINWLEKDVGLQAIKQSNTLQRLISDHASIMDKNDSSHWYSDSEFARFLSSKSARVWLTTTEGKRWTRECSEWQDWLKNNLKNSWIFRNYALRWLDTPIAEGWINESDGQKQFKTIINQWNNRERKDGIYASDYSTTMQTKVGRMYAAMNPNNNP